MFLKCYPDSNGKEDIVEHVDDYCLLLHDLSEIEISVKLKVFEAIRNLNCPK